MKIVFPGTYLFVIAALLAPSVLAESERSAAGAEEQIRSLENEERLAVLAGDIAVLERVWAETMIVNNPQNVISTDRNVVLGLVRKGLIQYSAFERTIEAIRFDGELAIVMGSETIVPAGNSPQAGRKLQRRFTNLWKKKDGTWRMIGRHANLIPSGPAEAASKSER